MNSVPLSLRPDSRYGCGLERRDIGLSFPVALSIPHQHANAPHPVGLLRVRDERPCRPTTRTMLLSSSTSPSPSRSAVACGRSSRKAVPPSPLPVAGIKHDTIDGFSRVPLARNFDFGGALHSRCQNKKYLCAIGSTSAGAQVSSSPLAVTS